MQSMIEELFHGNIQPNISFFRPDSKYAEQMKALSNAEERLRKHLADDAECLDALNTLTASQHEINILTGIEKFAYGFKLDALLMTECFTGKDELADPERYI